MLHLFLITKHTDTDADNGCFVVISVVNGVCRGWIMEVSSLKFLKSVECVWIKVWYSGMDYNRCIIVV